MAHTALVDAATLSVNLGAADWVVVDCRFDLADTARGEVAWRAGHIPGARYAHLDRDLSGPITTQSGRHPLPEPALLAQTLGAWGIGDRTQVVVYDDCGGGIAVRLWWMLRWLGHPAVALLDGGLEAWQAAGGVLTTELASVDPVVFIPRLVDGSWVDSAELTVAPGGWTLIDARSAERYRGEQEPIDPVAGRIPGALNRPLQQNLGPDGCFKPAAVLRGEFEELLGTAAPGRVLHYCGSGVTACHNLLAMELAGLHGSRLYPGSWSEWIRDPARAVETG